MSYVLHLGHQPSDISNISDRDLTTATDFFFSDRDINGLQFFLDRDTSQPFYIDFNEPSGDLWIQFFFKSDDRTPQPYSESSEFLLLYDANSTLIGGITPDLSADVWRAEVRGDTTETGNSVGISRKADHWFNIQVVVGANIELRVYLGSSLVSEAVATNGAAVGKPVQCYFPNYGFHGSSAPQDGQGYAHFVVLDGVSTIGRQFIRRTADVAGVHTDWSGDISNLADGSLGTRMSSDTAGQRQSVTTAGPTIPSGTAISAVHVQTVAQGGTDGVDQVAGSVRIGGTDYDTSLETVGTERPERVTYTWEQNPATSVDWTEGDLPDEIGIISG